MDGPNPFGEILLVEDNPGDVRLTEEMLKESGLDPTVHVVSDGSDALDFLHRTGDYADAPRPDAILLDLNLPRTSGTEVLERMDDSVRDIPVVLLSGSRRGPALESEDLDAEVDARVVKPIDPDEFTDVVRSLSKRSDE